MEELRLFGNMIEKLKNDRGITNELLCKSLNCTTDMLNKLIKGCVAPTFEQLDKLAEIFRVTSEELLLGDRKFYEKSVVHCMNDFSNPANREEILDIIEDYAKLASVVE